MKRYKALLKSLFVAVVMFFAGCDKIDPPYTTEVDHDHNGENGEVVSRVLLEEFTGHQCPNCPEASKAAKDLKALYGDQLVILTIHAGWFANTDDDLFSYDFTTPVGSALADHFNVQQFPIGLVNRTRFGGSLLLSHSAWAEAIPQLTDQPPGFDIHIDSAYDPDENTLKVDVNVYVLESSDCNYRLSVFLTESGIVKPQKTNDPDYPSGVIEDYEHNYVLRASFNDVWGEILNDASISPGMSFQKTYSLNWDNEWIPENSKIVAFVHHALTEEVMQVTASPVVPE